MIDQTHMFQRLSCFYLKPIHSSGPPEDAAPLGLEWVDRFSVGPNLGKQGSPAEAPWRSVDGRGRMERLSELQGQASVRRPSDLEITALSGPEAGMRMAADVREASQLK